MPNRFHNPKFGIFSAILSMLCPNLKFFKEHMKTFLIEQGVHGIRGYWSRYVLLVAMHAFQWPEVSQTLQEFHKDCFPVATSFSKKEKKTNRFYDYSCQRFVYQTNG